MKYEFGEIWLQTVKSGPKCSNWIQFYLIGLNSTKFEVEFSRIWVIGSNSPKFAQIRLSNLLFEIQKIEIRMNSNKFVRA